MSNRVSRRQYNKWSQQDQPAYQEPEPAAAPQQAPAQPAPGGDDRISQLKELGALKEQGILTDQEFAAEKARILGS